MSGYRTITPDEAAALLARGEEVFLVDVREPREYHAAHIPDALSLPADTFADRYSRELSPDDPVLLVCAKGRNSEAAAQFLVSQGFTDVATIAGGMAEWTGPLVARKG